MEKHARLTTRLPFCHLAGPSDRKHSSCLLTQDTTRFAQVKWMPYRMRLLFTYYLVSKSCPPQVPLLTRRKVLTPPEIATTHLVCRRFLRIGRDNNLWRDECFEISRFAVNLRRRKRAELIPAIPASEPRSGDLRGAGTDDKLGQHSVTSAARHDWHSSNERATERIRVMANWDPSYQEEKVDWYTEYIHRTAPISIKWFQKPLKLGDGTQSPLEVRGIGVHYPPGNEDATVTIAPLEDGSVCLWNATGGIMGRSPKGSLRGNATCGIMEGVSVDSNINRAFIAVEKGGCLMRRSVHAKGI